MITQFVKFIVLSGLIFMAGCSSAGKNYNWQDVNRVVEPTAPQ